MQETILKSVCGDFESQNEANCCVNKSELSLNKVHQRPQFSISSPDRKRGLSSIIETLKSQRNFRNGK